MCLPNFGFYKKEYHSEKFAYDHACGNVCPGDSFVPDISHVTCKHCLAKICPTSRAVDEGDSACNGAESTPEHLPIEEAGTAPALRN